MESPSMSKNSNSLDNQLWLPSAANWNTQKVDMSLSALPSDYNSTASPPRISTTTNAVKDRAPSVASTDSPLSGFDSGGGNPTASWVNSTYSFDNPLPSMHQGHTKDPEEKNSLVHSGAGYSLSGQNVGMTFSPTANPSWATSLSFANCPNVWGDFLTSDGNQNASLENSSDIQQPRSASAGDWSSPHLPSHKSNSTENVFQSKNRKHPFRQSVEDPTFFDANDFVNQQDMPPDTSFYSQPCGLILSSRPRSLSNELEKRDAHNFVENRKNMEKSSRDKLQDDGKPVAATTEAIIQSAISAPFDSQWGRTPVDQTTRWPTPSVGNLMSSVDGNRKSVNESNVWANEPSDGTRIWEEYYALQGLLRSVPSTNNNPILRPNNLHQNITGSNLKASPTHSRSDRNPNNPMPYELQSPSVPQRTQTNMMSGIDNLTPGGGNSSMFPLSPTQILNRGPTPWCAGSPLPSAGGPLNMPHVMTDTAPGWTHPSPFQGQPSMYGNRGTPTSCAPDLRQFPSPVANHVPQPFNLPPGLLNVPGSVMPRLKNDLTMRAQQVKYLCSLGFPRAEVQQALIMNNMDLDRALAELRMRYNGRPSHSSMDFNPSQMTNRMPLPGGPAGNMDYSPNVSALMNYSNAGSFDSQAGPGGHQMPGQSYQQQFHPSPVNPHVMQQLRYGMNGPINAAIPHVPSNNLTRHNNLSSSGVSSNTSTNISLDTQLPTSKRYENLRLLVAHLHHVESEIRQLQSIPARGGVQLHQIEMARKTLCHRHSHISQQIENCCKELKKNSSPLLTSNDSQGISHLVGHLNELSLNGPPPGNAAYVGGLGNNSVGGVSISHPLQSISHQSHLQTDGSSNMNIFPSTWHQ